MNIYLVEVTGVAMVSGSPVTTVFRYSTSGYATRPTDTPSSVYFEERIIEPASIMRSLFAPSRTSGRSVMGYGALKLLNVDGGLDTDFLGVNQYAFDGHPIKIYTGDDKNSFATFKLIFAGTVESTLFNLDEVTFTLKDNLYKFDKDLQLNRYGGTNVLPGGVDGTVDDLKAKVKPLLYGTVFNATPVLVNTTKLIYHVNNGSFFSVTPYDKGIVITADAAGDYTSIADMEANAPGAGTYRALPGAGYFRLGSTPAGVVTCDLQAASGAASNYLSTVFVNVATKALPSLTFVAGDLTALDTDAPQSLGVYLVENVDALDILDQLVDSVGAWYAFNTAGTQVRLGVLKEPSGTPVTEIDATNIFDIELITPNEDHKGVPVSAVKLYHSKNYTIQTKTDLAAGTPAARAARVASEYLDVESTGGANSTQYPLAPILEKYTLISNATDAATVAIRLRDLYKVKRNMFNISVRGLSADLNLNDVISLKFSRFGLSAGKLFRVISIENNYNIDGLNLVVWG